MITNLQVQRAATRLSRVLESLLIVITCHRCHGFLQFLGSQRMAMQCQVVLRFCGVVDAADCFVKLGSFRTYRYCVHIF